MTTSRVREYIAADRDAIMALAPRLPETGMANHAARAFYAGIGYQEEDVRLTKRIRGHDAEPA